MKLLLFSFLLLLFSVCNTKAQVRASYGESCNKTVRCDSKASLTCANNGTCVCLKESEMFFDELRSKCVFLTGERCVYTAIESGDMDGQQERRWTERLDCVENANCNDDGYCECNSVSFETPDGHCVPKNGYSEGCEKDSECLSNENLVCLGGKCSCNVTEAIYDEMRGKCVGKVGASCLNYTSCVKNAGFPDCRYGGDYRLCRCDSNFVKSEEGLCLVKYGGTCDPRFSACSSQFTCWGGICGCHFPDQQIYEGRRCKSIVNGPCRETVRGKVFQYECRGEAECRNDEGHPECLCRKGDIKSTDGECRKTFGSSCKKSEDCDGVGGLTCEEGECVCRDFQEYDDNINKCVGLWGANCYENSDTNTCGKNSYCKISRHDKNAGFCRCNPGAKVNGNRRCVLQVEEALNTTANKTEVNLVDNKLVSALEADLSNGSN